MNKCYTIYWTAGIDGKPCSNDLQPYYDLNTAHQELAKYKERYLKCDGEVREVIR